VNRRTATKRGALQVAQQRRSAGSDAGKIDRASHPFVEERRLATDGDLDAAVGIGGHHEPDFVAVSCQQLPRRDMLLASPSPDHLRRRRNNRAIADVDDKFSGSE
jgi:hypothetical protein